MSLICVGTGQCHSQYIPTFFLLTLEDGHSNSPPSQSPTPALLDSGSSISLIDARFVSNLPPGSIRSTNLTITGIGAQKAVGFVTLSFTVKGQDGEGNHALRFRHDFYVVEELCPGIILGVEWIQVHKISIDAFDGKACLPLKRFNLPPNHHCWISFSWDKAPPPKSDLLVGPSAWSNGSSEVVFALPACLLRTESQQVLITNLSSSHVTLPRGAQLTCASRLSTGARATPHCFSLGPEPDLGTDHHPECASADSDDVEVDSRPLDGREDLDYFAKGARSGDKDSALVDGIFQIGVDGSGLPPQSIIEAL
ncbi:hypothetical protein BCV69DRAFT_301965 [Microstroma glucosiphilum]|uniref:Peptidase A2 domain-containing protein n=1 Tax=Pseudomicrostroma glucosiphilum TaxID=1684307 RepID=A0A316TZC9_9BASI|nr:hypothetical protein BCV69DRAFT_301965 [Pseudomicrostroma glucosiphilum]PWN17663.1 hypothetical protein BCV69DRAFT_301965 [Pseudomicrostroma glucosiphilum]